MITQAVREARTEQDIHMLLTAYVHATRLGDELKMLSRHLTSLPLTGVDDVRERIQGLFTELGVASRGLNDGSRLVIKEALYVFGAALKRLKSLEAAQRNEGSTSQSNTRRDRLKESSGAGHMESVHHGGGREACPEAWFTSAGPRAQTHGGMLPPRRVAGRGSEEPTGNAPNRRRAPCRARRSSLPRPSEQRRIGPRDRTPASAHRPR